MTRTAWIAYFVVKAALMADLITHGPLCSLLSAATGLPIE